MNAKELIKKLQELSEEESHLPVYSAITFGYEVSGIEIDPVTSLAGPAAILLR